MTTQEAADKLVAHCRAGEAMEALHSLYSADIVSVEATPMPDGTREMKGIQAVEGKAQWWVGAHEIYCATVEGPMVSGSRFAFALYRACPVSPNLAAKRLDNAKDFSIIGQSLLRRSLDLRFPPRTPVVFMFSGAVFPGGRSDRCFECRPFSSLWPAP